MDGNLDIIESSIAKTAALITGVREDQLDRATPCTSYTVGILVDHLVGWAHVFDAATNDLDIDRNPDSYVVQEGRAEAFEAAGRRAVEGLRRHGVDRQMRMVVNPIPGTMVANMMRMEYPGHGWDLAVATGQPVPFTDEEAEEALQAARVTISPEYRGYEEGMFHPVREVDDSATAIQRYVSFLGRDPEWDASDHETQP